jgi:hypothetical protein
MNQSPELECTMNNLALSVDARRWQERSHGNRWARWQGVPTAMHPTVASAARWGRALGGPPREASYRWTPVSQNGVPLRSAVRSGVLDFSGAGYHVPEIHPTRGAFDQYQWNGDTDHERQPGCGTCFTELSDGIISQHSGVSVTNDMVSVSTNTAPVPRE